MHKTIVTAGFLVAGAAWAKPSLPPLKIYTDAQTKVSFYYPRGWRNITVADDATKAEARSDDGTSRMVVEVVATPRAIAKVLGERVPGGELSDGSGGWKCIEGEVDGATRHTLLCGKRTKPAVEGANEYLVIGLSSKPEAFKALGGKALVAKLAEGVKGFKSPAGDE